MMKTSGRNSLFITLGIIAALLVLYFVSAYQGGNPEIPELEQWNGNADEITIARNGETIRLYRKEGMWRINREGFPADSESVQKMEKKLHDLEITDLTSRRPHYERFGLTPENSISVVVKKDGAEVRKILIGNKSAKTSHTFIRVGDRPEVFKAAGVLRTQFGNSAEGYRDKNILNAAPKSIVSVEIKFNNNKYTFMRDTAVTGKNGKKTAEKSGAPAGGKIICLEYRDVELHEVKMANLMKSFNPLQTQSFPEVAAGSIGKSLCTVTVKTEKKSVALNFYKGATAYSYYCTSSDAPYVFSVASYTAERYMKDIQDFKR
jgi:hypothetical protein